MSKEPDIREEILDGEISDEELKKIREAVEESSDLKNLLKYYNNSLDGKKDEKFYKEHIKKLASKINSKKKSDRVEMVKNSKKSKKDSRKHPTVLRGIIVKEYEGDWIWVEPQSAQKGEYGVRFPSHLSQRNLTVGTEVALNPQNFQIIDVLKKRKDPDFECINTSKTFQDIGGLDDVIQTLRRNVGIQLEKERREVIEKWGVDLDKSLMLVGPPGTGKTLMVKALANEYEADMFMINGPQLVEKFIGEGAKKVRRLYDQARSSDRPAIVFIDEIDSIAKKRQENRRHGGEEVERTMSQLLSELDGLGKEEGNQNVVSIFATNKPSIIDPAIINRCSAIEVSMPDNNAKKEILQVHTRKFDIDDDVDIWEIVDKMPDQVSGRDIEQIAKQSALSAIYRGDDLTDLKVKMEDFEHAIKDLEDGNIGMEKDFLSPENIHEEIFA